MQITAGTLSGLFTSFQTDWSQTYEAQEVWISKVARKYSSGTRFQIYSWLQRMPALRQWLGPRQVNALATYLYQLENLKFEDTIGIQREDIEDDQFSVFGDALKLLGEQSKKWPDQQMAAKIELGTSTIIYDGANFFDTQHPVNKYDASILSRTGSTVQSNLFSNLALTPDNFMTVYQTMRGWVGEDGKPLGVRPNLLGIPPELEYVALNILKAVSIAPQTVGQNTQVGANANVIQGICDYVVMPELTNTKAWYLMDTTRSMKPFLFQERYAPDLVPLVSPSDPNVVNLDMYSWNVRARGNFGFGLWWLCAKAVGP